MNNESLKSVTFTFPQFYPEDTVIISPIVAESNELLSLVAHFQPFLPSELSEME